MLIFVHNGEDIWQICSVKVGVVEKRRDVQYCVRICGDLNCFRDRSGVVASSAAV